MSERDDLAPDERELLRKHGASLDGLRAHHADCPRLDILLASQARVLPEEAARNVAAHVRGCSFCQILLKDLVEEDLAGASAEEEQRARHKVWSHLRSDREVAKGARGFFSIWFWRAAPATALAVVAILIVVWVRSHQATSPASSSVPIAQQPAKPATPSVLEWEKLPIRLQAGSVLVLRGEPRSAQEKYASELTRALSSYRDDDYAKAAKRLAGVVRDFPGGVEGQLYLGISQLKLEQNPEAIAALEAAQELAPEQFRDDATWYLALAYQRAGNTKSMLDELQMLCKGKNAYSSRACAAKQKLSPQSVENPER